MFHYHQVFGSVAAMQRLVDWTGITYATVKESDLGVRQNLNKTQWIPGRPDWIAISGTGSSRSLMRVITHLVLTAMYERPFATVGAKPHIKAISAILLPYHELRGAGVVGLRSHLGLSKMSTVTVVIPTYKRPHLLGRAVASVLMQSYSDFIVHICDNASGDATRDVAEAYVVSDQRVKYLYSPKDIGYTEAFALGVASVETDYWVLLSDDDFLLPNMLADCMRGFAEFPAAGFSSAKVIIAETDTHRVFLRNRDWPAGSYQPSVTAIHKMARSHFANTGIVFRSEIRDILGNFDSSGSDRLYTVAAAGCVPFFVCESYGAVLTNHAGSITSAGWAWAQSITEVNEWLVDTVSRVSALEIPADRKALILAYVWDMYFDVYEKRALRGQYVEPTAKDQAVYQLGFPRRCRTAGLLLSMLDRFPRLLRAGLARSVAIAWNARAIRARKIRRSTWAGLPNGGVIRGDPDDVARFVAAISSVLPASGQAVPARPMVEEEK